MALTTDQIKDIVRSKAAFYGIPEGIALAQVQAESDYNVNAYNAKSGATGLMQIIPSTAKWLGLSDPLDPAENVDAGMRYLRSLYDQYGDWATALAAYNAGPGRIQEYGGIPPFPETQNYVEKILVAAGMSNNASTDTSAGEGDGNGALITLVVLGIAGLVWAVTS